MTLALLSFQVQNTLGIYSHIPFCASRCHYCNFDTGLYPQEILSHYPNRLKEAYKKELPQLLSSYHCASIYFGGGTPSLIPVDEVLPLLEVLYTMLQQSRVDISEVTIEINPADYNKNDLKRLKENGVTKVSFGIQSFNDNELKSAGRRHTTKDARNILEQAISVGFPVISADLIQSLPGQTAKSWRNSLTTLFSYDIHHCSLYDLTIEENTLFNTQRSSFSFPSEELLGELEAITDEVTNSSAFMRYEISNYARSPLFQSKHNTHYWNGGDYIGFGAGAVSTIKNRRWKIDPSPERFLKENITVEEELLSEKTLQKEKIFLQLRTSKGLEKKFYENYLKMFCSASEKASKKKKLALFLSDHYILDKRGRYALSLKGFRFYNTVVSELI